MADNIPEAKVVLLGTSMVGKTTLVTRFTCGEFDPSIKSTIGACYASKLVEIPEGAIKLQIWDTAGQEKFKTLVPMYFRGAKVAILVYSVIDAESKKEVEFWANSVKQATTGNTQLIFVGNKIDRESERVVQKSEGEELAKQLGGDFIEVSAKENTEVQHLLELIGKKALEVVKNEEPEPTTQTITPTNKKPSGCCK